MGGKKKNYKEAMKEPPVDKTMKKPVKRDWQHAYKGQFKDVRSSTVRTSTRAD